MGVGDPSIIKIRQDGFASVRSPALLPVLEFVAKTAFRFCKRIKTVCFWQRLKRLKTEKTFAGQGAY